MNVRIGSRPGTLVSVVLTMGLVASPAVPAAGTDDREADAASEFWMPNPAAFYVSELGYEYEIVLSPEGERGVCVLPDGVPLALSPGVETTVAVRIEEITDTLVPGSAFVHYRYGSGDFATARLIGLGGDAHAAVLPPADCLHTPEFYISADGVRFGTVTSPDNTPAEAYRCPVGVLTTVFSDDFETHQG